MKKLKRLSSLEALHFSDGLWGESPVVRLFNYAALVMYYLPSLEILDEVNITKEIRVSKIESVAKRMIYYASKERKLNSIFKKLKQRMEVQRKAQFKRTLLMS